VEFKTAHIRPGAHRGVHYELCYYQPAVNQYWEFHATHFIETDKIEPHGYRQVESCEERPSEITAAIPDATIVDAAFNPPQSYSTRTNTPACESTYDNVMDQDACGACYAFATAGAAADIQCVAKAKAGASSVPKIAYSVQDILTCGSRKNGQICQILENVKTNVYANGCEGGSTDMTMNYAVENGLLDEKCSLFDVEDHVGQPGVDPNDVYCEATNNNPNPVTISCKQGLRTVSVGLDGFQKAHTDNVFCTCPAANRGGYNNVVTVSKVNAQPLTCNIQTSAGGQIQCGQNALNLPSSGSFTTASMTFCRCPQENKVGYDKVVKTWESGYGHLPECTRASSGCTSTKMYTRKTVAGETAIMQGIMDVGSVILSLDIYNTFMNFKGDGVFILPRTIYTSEQVGRLSASQKKACDSNPTQCAYFVGRHAVVTYGWGQDASGTKYWLARNTWTKSWGNGGHFKFLRSANQAGIENHGVYANSAPPPTRCAPTETDSSSGQPCAQASFDPNSKMCTVKNTCSLQSVNFKLSYDTGASQCGLIYTFPPLQPGASMQKQDLLNCCVESETSDKGFNKEPGTCFTQSSSRGQCVWKNGCNTAMNLAKAGESSFFPFPAGATFAIDPSFCAPGANIVSSN
jgi:hypothetical protein